jgi:methionine-rich copper-binding protein CopC
MRRLKHVLVVLMLLTLALLGGVGLAHAYLQSSDPEAGSVVSELEVITLQMTEAVELNFSIFKVYHLPDAPEAPRERLEAARALMREVLLLRDDADARADAGVITEGRTSEMIEIALKDALEPGVYVVMWRVLSIDTHTTEDLLIFEYAPDAS